MEKLIVIVLKNGHKVVWTPKEYDDYIYDGKAFIVKQNDAWVGIYNFDSVISIVLREKE